MRYVPFVGALLLSASPMVLAATASIDLNQDVAHLEVMAQPNPKALEFNAGLYHHDDDSNARSDDDAELYYVGAVTKDRMTNFRDVEFSLGGQLGMFDADQIDGSYAGLAAGARYFLPDAKGVSTAVNVMYAPDVLTADDLENVYTFNAEVAWRIIPRGEIFGGYRHIELEIDEIKDITFEESWFAGFRLQF